MTSHISQSIIDKVFAHDVFRGLDRDRLVKHYDVNGSQREIKAPLRAQEGQVRPTGPVIMSIRRKASSSRVPELYSFGADIAWNPPSAACAAITIASNDVVLDLGGFTLKATVLDNSRHIVGIFVRNASAVIIRNGALANMCLYGVCTEDSSKVLVDKITVSGLVFDNLNIRNICPAGIHVDGADDVRITDCVVQYMYVTCDIERRNTAHQYVARADQQLPRRQSDQLRRVGAGLQLYRLAGYPHEPLHGLRFPVAFQEQYPDAGPYRAGLRADFLRRVGV